LAEWFADGTPFRELPRQPSPQNPFLIMTVIPVELRPAGHAATDRRLLSPPGVERDVHGKPLLALDTKSLYAFGHLIRLTEELILDQFSRGLVSGTTQTCI
jgi:hypothetical protein